MAVTTSVHQPRPLSFPSLIVVVGQQRSGTTALNRTLSLGTKVHSFEEVFHNVLESSPANFFAFRRQELLRSPELSVPTATHQRELWSSFAAQMRRMTDKPLMMIDAKYNSWHHLNTVWYYTGGEPYFATMLREGRAVIVHLVRDDVFAQLCSGLLAEGRRRWHSTEPILVDQDIRLHVEPTMALNRMDLSRRQTEQFRSYFHGYSRYGEFRYEDLISGDYISRDVLTSLEALVGEDVDGHHKIPTSKMSPPISRYVDNGDALVKFFADTPYGKLVADAFR